MKKEYYVLFSCDKWKSYSSMRLMGVFSITELRKVVKKIIEKGDFEYEKSDVKEINKMTGSDISRVLKYGYVETVGLNEEL